MLFGVDTSGKIGEGNLYVATVAHDSSDIMDKLRNMVAKRHKGLSGRRRMKASFLNESELSFVAGNIKSRYEGILLTIPDFSTIRTYSCNLRDWKIKSLAAVIYLCSRKLIRNGDMILVDRDYSEDVMRNLFAYLKTLFSAEGKNVIMESGTSFNEVAAKADLIAGCFRKGVIRPSRINPKEIVKLVSNLQ